MLLVAPLELIPRVRVAKSAEVLERVSRRHTPELRRDLVCRPGREALQQTTAVGAADAGRVDNPVWRDRGHVDAIVPGDHRRSLFAPGDNEGARFEQDVVLAQPGLLTQQLELVV